LWDVRRYPGSRRHPHFKREALENSLPAQSIAYEWHGDTLGGRRRPVEHTRHPAWREESFRAYADYMDTDEFRRALGELKQAQGVAIMCAETLWWQCHRRLISDALTVDGVEVRHILDDKRSDAHKLSDFLRVDENGRPVYDVGVEKPLF
jgi:uncharacterized protein (DUF488 family)